jgi:hypothetical protein
MWYYQEKQAQLEARMGGPPARVFFFDCAEGTMVGRLLARCADTAILARADDLRPRADANEAAALRMMEGFVSATLPVIDVYDQAGLVTVLSTGDERSPAKAYDEFERTLAAALPQAGSQERQRQMDQELAQRAHQEQLQLAERRQSRVRRRRPGSRGLPWLARPNQRLDFSFNNDESLQRWRELTAGGAAPSLGAALRVSAAALADFDRGVQRVEATYGDSFEATPWPQRAARRQGSRQGGAATRRGGAMGRLVLRADELPDPSYESGAREEALRIRRDEGLVRTTSAIHAAPPAYSGTPQLRGARSAVRRSRGSASLLLPPPTRLMSSRSGADGALVLFSDLVGAAERHMRQRPSTPEQAICGALDPISQYFLHSESSAAQ